MKGTVIVFPMESISGFCNQIIEYLFNDIDAKSKLYKKPVVNCLFILNNMNYILKSIKGIFLSVSVDQQILKKIETCIKKQVDEYRLV
jgi:hypothetical protein